MIEEKPIIILVDDDRSVLRALQRLLVSSGFDVRPYERPSSVLSTKLPESNACLVIDIHLPEMSGVQLFDILAASGCQLPIVFITGESRENIRAEIERVKSATVSLKPFGKDALLGAVREALKIKTSRY